MHELALTESIFRAALRAAQGGGAKRICAIRLRIGPYSDVVPAYVEKCFALLSRGSMAEGARIEVERAAARIRCAACKEESEAGRGVYVCPRCQSPRIRLLSGTECLLDSIEVE